MELRRLVHTKKEHYVFLLSLFIHVGVMWRIKADQSRRYEEFCMDENYKATCDHPNHVILMRAAKAGRLWLGKCIKQDRGHIGCSKDVLTHMDTRCSGFNMCDVPVVEVTTPQTQCPNDLKLFLVAEYDCIPVTPCDQTMCEMSEHIPLNVSPSSSGYIASSQVASTGCGSSRCPWTIQVPEGQKINLTLYDFTLTTDSTCEQYGFGTIYDGVKQEKINNCLKRRQQVVYKSTESVIKLALSQMYAQSNGYMIRYEAIGCKNIDIPQYAEMERKDDYSMSVNCRYSHSTWHLTCDGTAWIGEIGVCPGTNVNTAKNTGEASQSSSLGLLFVIGLGVALGIVIGFVLLCVVAMYMKRKSRSQMSKSTYLINDNSQYRDYLSKTGTMFGLYPTNQNTEAGPDGTLIYRPMHDYTSTLHPQNRPLPHIVEVVNLPPGHQLQQADCNSLILQDDISLDGAVLPPSGGRGVGGGNPASGRPYTTTATRGHNIGEDAVPSGSGNNQQHSTAPPAGHPGNQQQPRDHIYELPNFPDRNRARSADSGLAYSVGSASDQTNHRTT